MSATDDDPHGGSARELLKNEDPSAPDVEWARGVLAGRDDAPPAKVAPAVARALVARLVEDGAGEALSRLAARDDRTLAKAARTGLHHLRSRRVKVEVPRRQVTPAKGTGADGTSTLPSVVTSYDARNQRLVWLALPGDGGVLLCQHRISLNSGLIAFDGGVVPRRRYRGLVRELRENLITCTTSTDDARWFVFNAVRRTRAAGRELPAPFVRARRELGPEPSGEHPALAIAAAPDEPAALAALYELDVLRTWLPAEEDLERLMLRREEIATSRLMVDEAQRAQQLQHTIDQWLAAYFDEDRVSGARRLLLDTAHVLHGAAQLQDAARLRAAADLFGKKLEQVVTHPFVRRFIERLLPASVAMPDPRGADDSGGLIVP